MMMWQFWLLTAAIYDANYRLKSGGKHFIATVLICLFMALVCSPVTQAFLKGVFS